MVVEPGTLGTPPGRHRDLAAPCRRSVAAGPSGGPAGRGGRGREPTLAQTTRPRGRLGTRGRQTVIGTDVAGAEPVRRGALRAAGGPVAARRATTASRRSATWVARRSPRGSAWPCWGPTARASPRCSRRSQRAARRRSAGGCCSTARTSRRPRCSSGAPPSGWATSPRVGASSPALTVAENLEVGGWLPGACPSAEVLERLPGAARPARRAAPARSPAGSSRWWWSPGRCAPGPGLPAARRALASGWRRWWSPTCWPPCAASSTRGPRCCWSSRTSGRRCRSPTAATCSSPARWSSPAPPRRWRRTPRSPRLPGRLTAPDPWSEVTTPLRSAGTSRGATGRPR